jgi:phospholipase/lecithinase/hemolysin
MRLHRCIAAAFLFSLCVLESQSAGPGELSPYRALYAFGFSWTDTHDSICGWGLPDYEPGRACNGEMWPEFLSTNLGLAYLSVNNRAQCGADSSQVLTQTKGITAAPAVGRALHFVWAGDSDFLYAASSGDLPTRTMPCIPWTNDVAWSRMASIALNNNSNAIEHLYSEGARSIVVQNNLDFSRLPFLVTEFGTNQSRATKLQERIMAFNGSLASALASLAEQKPDLRLILVDVRTNLNNVIENPVAYGFTKPFPSALDDPALADKSFGGPGRNYVFWDGLHPTSRIHELMADWSMDALTNSILEKVKASFNSGLLALDLERLLVGRTYLLQHSSDARSWEPIQSFTALAGTNRVQVDATVSKTGFYRLAWTP